MNRFKHQNENKFGMKPIPARLNYTTESQVQEILPTTSIWESLQITEEEYYEKYHNQPIPEKAIELEQEITEETKESLAEK